MKLLKGTIVRRITRSGIKYGPYLQVCYSRGKKYVYARPIYHTEGLVIAKSLPEVLIMRDQDSIYKPEIARLPISESLMDIAIEKQAIRVTGNTKIWFDAALKSPEIVSLYTVWGVKHTFTVQHIRTKKCGGRTIVELETKEMLL